MKHASTIDSSRASCAVTRQARRPHPLLKATLRPRSRRPQAPSARLSDELAVQPLRSFRPGDEVSNEGITDQEMSGVSNITTRSRRKLFFHSNQVLRAKNRFYGSAVHKLL